MRARIRVFIDDDEEPREEVDMPIPEPPEELSPPVDGWGGWKWVGALPKARIDLSENYCLALYIVRTRSTQARKLGQVARRGSNRVPRLREEREGDDPVQRGRGRGGRPEALTPEKKRKAVELRAAGATEREIARELGTSTTPVRRLLTGVPAGSTRGGPRRALDDGTVEDVGNMIADGGTTAEIVRATGVSKAQVNKIRRERAGAIREEPAADAAAPPAPPEPPRQIVEPLRVRLSEERETRDNGPHKCPTCGDGFASERGRNRHETVAHERMWTPPRAVAAPPPEPRADAPADGKAVRMVLTAVFSGYPVSRAASIGEVSVSQAAKFVERAMQLMDAAGPAAATAWVEAEQTGQQQMADRIARELAP